MDAASARTGATGALLDEYLRALHDLQALVATLPDEALGRITDPHTGDDNCRTPQAILAHVVHAGYGYATSILQLKDPAKVRPPKQPRTDAAAYLQDLDDMFAFTEAVLQRFRDDELRELGDARKIRSGWGAVYDPEQMMEHAIVHILRHRRQLEGLRRRGLI